MEFRKNLGKTLYNLVQKGGNVVGSMFISTLFHELSHLLTALAEGSKKVYGFYPYPHISKGRLCFGEVLYDMASLSPLEKILSVLAGPLSNVAVSEVVNYSLRSGKVPKRYQSFLATLSLVSKAFLANIAATTYLNRNDFSFIERFSSIPGEVMTGLTAVYLLANYKRIIKEVKVALGKEYYNTKVENNS